VCRLRDWLPAMPSVRASWFGALCDQHGAEKTDGAPKERSLGSAGTRTVDSGNARPTGAVNMWITSASYPRYLIRVS